jgi:hypothetical protein
MAMQQLQRGRAEAEVIGVTPRKHHLSWRREVLLIAVVYGAYTLVRNTFGSAKLNEGARLVALNNALRVIDVERAVGLFHELAIQHWLLHTPVMSLLNLYYSVAHFAVTIGIVLWMMIRHRHRFRRWRSTLLFTTVLATIGFSMFPLMPPRLISSPTRYGGAGLITSAEATQLQFDDTLRTGQGAWSFDSAPVDDLSNQYAAMPSLHMAWSLWCAIVIGLLASRRWVRWLAALHPAITLLAIIATANHYLLDAIGGVAVLGVGYGLARVFELVMARWRASRAAGAGDALGATA